MRMWSTLILLASCMAFCRAGDEAPAKVDAPSAADIKLAETLIKEVFAEQYELTKPNEKLDLARKLAQQGGETKENAAARFVLFREAALLAAQAGELKLALTHLAKLETHFKFDPLPLKKDLLAALGTTKDAELTKAVAAMKTLCDKPDDPVANTIYGRYACLVLDDWPNGLDALQKGANPIFKTLVGKELAGAADAAAQLALGDAWFEAYEKETAKDVKPILGERARQWYTKALPTLTGLNKTKTEKRLAGIPPVTSSTAAGASPATQTNATGKVPVPKPLAAFTGDLKGSTLEDGMKIGAGVYRVTGNYVVSIKALEAEITLEAGCELRGGTFNLGQVGSIACNGTATNPVILRNVMIYQDLGAKLTATYTIFDKCKFVKGGSFYQYYSSKWECSNCIFYKSIVGLAGQDYGFKFVDCVFAEMTLPNIQNKRDDGFDHMLMLHKEWSTMKNLTFINCVVPSTVVWCAGEANYYRCRFPGGEIFESGKDTEIELYVMQPDRFPHEAWATTRPKDKPVKLKYRKDPLPFVALPQDCAVPEMAPYMSLIYPKQ